MALEFLKNYQTFIDFEKKLKDIGVYLDTIYILGKYEGPSKNVKHQLCLKKGILSKKVLIIGEDKKNLEVLRSYFNNFPLCRKWKFIIRSKPSPVKRGDWMIIENQKFVGVHRVKEKVKKIIKELGGNKDDIDFVINGSGKKIMGYFSLNNPALVEKYIDIIHVGATTPVSYKEVISFLENMKQTTGKEVWNKLLQFWKSREKTKNEVDDEINIERKYIEKYLNSGLVEEEYVVKLLKEYENQEVVFEPPRNRLDVLDINSLYAKIDRSELLIPKEKAEAIFALMSILDGSFPQKSSTVLLKKVFGKEFEIVIQRKKKELT